jgi:signal transduction histidine kinase
MGSLQTGAAFVTFLRECRSQILEAWERRVRALPPAANLNKQALIDHLPAILDQIAEAAEAALSGEEQPRVERDPDHHAIVRLHQGYELGHVVTEYSLLRETILELSSQQTNAYPAELRVFNRVLDGAITQAVSRYSQASQRMLKALDRISMLAFGERKMENVLRTLLEVIVQACPAVDEVTVLLKEGDRLYVREAVGITGERDASFSVAVGEGFAGTIAARRQPLFLRSAATDPLVESQFLRDRGIKAIYGVPLIDGAEVIGVAHMGSVTAYEFADEDMLLFRAMANRASQLIIETRLKEQLREQADELKLVLESAQLGTWSWDLRTENHRCDERTRALFALAPGENPSYERFLARLAPGDREATDAAIRESLKTGRDLRVRFRVPRPDGQERHMEARGALVQDDEGRPVRVLGTVQDRTDDAYAERERELFLAALGHDLRGPLNAISLAAASLIRSGGLAEAAIKTVGRIARSSEWMARLIDQLLDFARGRAGHPITLTHRRVDLADLWRQVIDEIMLSEPERRIVFRADANTVGEWDPDRMLQVFQNLVRNATQYGDPARPITIAVSGDRERVGCEVHNDGPPIPPELLPNLFDPFRRGLRGHGLGLGLYIVHQIVAAHGGRVEATSSAEEGTTFRVTLPRAAQAGSGR